MSLYILKSNQQLKKIVSNTGWIFAERGLRIGLTLLVSGLMARYLGTEQFGQLNYALAFVALFSVISSLGLDSLLVRDVVQSPSSKDELLGTVFNLKVIGSLAAILLSFLTIRLLQPEEDLLHWLVLISAVGLVFRAFDVIDLFFQSQVASKFGVIAKSISFALSSLIKLGLIFFSASLLAFAWAGITEFAIYAICLVILYQSNHLQVLRWHWNPKRAFQLLSQSWPLMLSGMSVLIYMKIDQVLLGAMVGSEALGIYSAIVPLSEVWYFIPVAIVISATPYIIKARETSESLYYQRLQQLFSLLTALSFFVAIPMTFLSEPLIVLIYGQSYKAGGVMLAIHIWACIFVSLGVSQGIWDVNEGLTGLRLQRTLIAAILNIGLNLALIPLYAGSGAATSTVISYAASGYILNIMNKKTRRIFFLQTNSFLFFRGCFRWVKV